MAADHAVVGYVHGGWVRAEFLASVLAVVQEGATPVDAVIAAGSGPNISTARNWVTRSFLEDQAAPWLFMCDTDMWFGRDTLDRLIEAADPSERPILGGLCWSENPGGDPYTTMYELAESPSGDLCFTRYKEWPEDAVMPVAATGAACLLIHRDALETIAKASADKAAPWFRESVIGSGLVGEDLTFCLRAAAAGIPVHVATGVKAGHMKTQMLI